MRLWERSKLSKTTCRQSEPCSFEFQVSKMTGLLTSLLFNSRYGQIPYDPIEADGNSSLHRRSLAYGSG